MQDFVWQTGENYLTCESLYRALQAQGITRIVIDALFIRLIEQNVFRPDCTTIPAGYSIEQGVRVFREEAESISYLITTRERWYKYLADVTQATMQTENPSLLDPGNPYRALLQLGLAIHTEELQRASSLTGKRYPLPSEWGPPAQAREAHLQRLVDATLRAADRTGVCVEEVERRVMALAAPVRALLFWLRDAANLTPDDQQQREFSGLLENPIAIYISRHYRALVAAWDAVNTLAVRWDVRPAVSAFDSDRGSGGEHHEAQRGASESGAPVSLPGSGNTAAGTVSPPETQFLEFPPQQRKLIGVLYGKGPIALADVTRAVYGTRNTAMSTLERLLGRTNKNLSDRDYRLEIKRKANTLSLQTF